MAKTKFLLFLFFFSAVNIQAQKCNCKASYEWVKKIFEENDAGYAHILKAKGQEPYNLHNKLTVEKIEKISDLDSCITALENWVRFFRTDHFRFTKKRVTAGSPGNTTSFQPVRDNQLSSEQFRKYLSERKVIDSIEGVWETPAGTIAIKRKGNEYAGVTLTSTVPNWEPGDVRFVVANDLQSATRYLSGFQPKKVGRINVWGKGVRILQLDNLLLKKVFPVQTADAATDEYYRLKTSASPFGYKRDSNTVYIHINSFNYENKQAIDSTLKSLQAAIVSTPNLIIDLRDCQGGADASFKGLLPYLYTNPIRTVMAEFYSTPLNNKIWENLSGREGLEAEEKESYKKIETLMNSKLGQFVNIFGKDVELTKFDKVLPYPKNIGIIIHENNFSTTEEFILSAKQSKKAKFFGRKTGGALDVSNMVEITDPENNFIFEYCISRSLRIPEFSVDDIGIHPDFYLDRFIPENEWVDYVSSILNY